MGTILIGNIKGPQGSQGIQGPQGPVGPVGPTGPGADIYNGLDQTEAGVAGLDSYQGRVLDQKKLDVAKVANNLTTAVEGYALDARQGKALDEALHDAVTPSANSTSFTVKNGSITSGGYIKIGRLVIVNMRVAMTAALSEYSYLVTGLPRPVTTATEGNPVGTVANNLNKSITLVLAGGAGGFFLGAGAGLSSTQAIVLSCVYVSDD